MWIAIDIEPEVQVTEPVSKFQRTAIIVGDLYNKLLSEKKLKFKGVSKISISLTSLLGINFVSGPIKGLDSIATLRKTYDFVNISSIGTENFNLEILKLIHNSVLELATKYGWSIDGFDNIYDTIIECNFKHTYFEIPLRYSHNGKYKAGVRVDMLEDGAQIYLLVQDVSSPIDYVMFPMIKTHLNRMFITQFVKKGKWLSNDIFQVSSKSDETHFVASISSRKLEIIFTPKTKSQDQLIDELLVASVDTKREFIMNLVKDIPK